MKTEREKRLEDLVEWWADWLVDAVAGATQNRALLRHDKAEDKALTGAILANGLKALTQCLKQAREALADEGAGETQGEAAGGWEHDGLPSAGELAESISKHADAPPQQRDPLEALTRLVCGDYEYDEGGVSYQKCDDVAELERIIRRTLAQSGDGRVPDITNGLEVTFDPRKLPRKPCRIRIDAAPEPSPEKNDDYQA